MTDATVGSAIDDHVGDLEVALCDIFGITIDTNVTETPLDLDNAGRITKQLLRLAAAAPMGIRLRDTTNSKEFRLSLNNSSITFDANTGTEGSPVWTNRLTIALGTGLPTLAGATDPSGANDLTRKGYVDAHATANPAHTGATNLVHTTGDESVGGKKTFTTLPEVSADPTTANQLTRKSYVDSKAGTEILLVHYENSGTAGGGQTAGSWATRKLNRECYDTGNNCSLASNQFTLGAGTYEIEAMCQYWAAGSAKTRLYNVSDGAVQQDINGNSIIGTSCIAYVGSYNCEGQSYLRGRFTLAASKTLRLESRTSAGNTSTGWGYATSFGEEEIYAVVNLRKVA